MSPTPPVSVDRFARLDAFLARLDASARTVGIPVDAHDLRLFGVTPRYGAPRLADVTAEGHAREEGSVVVGYRVVPTADTRALRAAWARVEARWAASPARWSVAPHPAGGMRVTLRETYVELAYDARIALGDDAVPEPVVAPCALRAPLSDAAVRLALALRTRRFGSVVPRGPLRELLASLPGWACVDVVAARPLGWRWDFDDLAALPALAALPPGWFLREEPGALWFQRRGDPVTDADRAAVQSVFRMDGGGDHAVLNDPVGSFLAAELVWKEPDAKAPQGALARTLRVRAPCRATPAERIVAPSGASYPLYRDDVRLVARRPSPDRVLHDAGFWGWAEREGLLLAAEAALATVGASARHRAARPALRSLTNLGECQLCGWYWKLRFEGIPGVRVLVDHGYCYPDTEGYRGGALGERANHCGGVGYVPYEKGHDALDALLPHLRAKRAQAEAARDRVYAAQREKTPVNVPTSWRRRLDRGEFDAPMTVLPTDAEWTALVARKLDAALFACEVAADREAWCEERIRTWTLCPLQEEESSAGAHV